MIFCNQKIEEIFDFFQTSPDGISDDLAQKKQEKFGKNILPENKKNYWKILLLQFSSPLILILFLAAGISIALPILENGEIYGHDWIDPIAILGIVAVNGLLGFFQEIKAENALAELKKMQPQNVVIKRNGKLKSILSKEIVPGDILILEEGEKIPADCRILKSTTLKVDESALTGESIAQLKNADWIGEASIGDQENMLFSGTKILEGNGEAVVVKIGLQTEIGKIAKMVSQVEKIKTPLEIRLESFSKKIGIIILGICFIIICLGIWRSLPIFEIFLTAVALGVSAIPEGLPAVLTISLALGVRQMAKKNVLVRKLSAVEALGSISVIATDKTGTITENKMKVVEIFFDQEIISVEKISNKKNSDNFKKLLQIAANCESASLPNFGDPTEIALLQFAKNFGVEKNLEKINEIPFSSKEKIMKTEHKIGEKKVEFWKGAPEKISKFFSKTEQEKINIAAKKMAQNGLRTIAASAKFPGENQIFFGIFGLLDPPRKTVAQSIEAAKKAGIKTVMITGDHPETAKNIGKKINLLNYQNVISGDEMKKINSEELQQKVKTTGVFARVSPEDKLKICHALQKNGEIVAMTGDGVNDAPAISQANIGISMGKIGTGVAREASEIILLDDNFSSIVSGIAEGRRIFANIKKSILFLLRTNFDEIILVLLAIFLFLPLPLLPIHILFLNLLTDSFPALALSTQAAEKNQMLQKPQKISDGFLSGEWRKITFLSVFTAGILFFQFLFFLSHLNENMAQTLTLTNAVFVEFAVIFSIKNKIPFWKKNSDESKKNIWIIGSVFLAGIVFLVTLFSPISQIFSVQAFPKKYWLFPIFSAITIFLFSEFLKIFSAKK